MKKIILFLGILQTIITSCKEDRPEEFLVRNITHKVQIRFSDEFNEKPAPNVNLKLINKETSQQYITKTGEDGTILIDILPGTYSIEATLSLSSEAMDEILNTKANDAVFNDAVYDVVINKDKNVTTEMTLVNSKSSTILIKQVYYTGSHRKKGSSFRDQFFEIHNNSKRMIYLDGLCFAQLAGVRKMPSSLESYHLPNGQYDYSKSFENNGLGEKANTDYVYADQIISFPGTGTDYPLPSGKSVLVASTALNHKTPLTVKENGGDRVYSAEDPSLTLDLSGAHFEVYEGKKYSPFSIDTPANNMIVNYNINAFDLFLMPYGIDAYAIFYAKSTDIDSWKRVHFPNVPEDKIAKAKKMYVQIPNNIIIDGVELQHYDSQKSKPKRLPKSIDAGQIKGIKGGYSSESAIRKVKKVDGDKIFYQDTNNSNEDFEIIEFPNTSSIK